MEFLVFLLKIKLNLIRLTQPIDSKTEQIVKISILEIKLEIIVSEKKHSAGLKSYYQSLGDIDDLEKFLDLLIIENQDSISIQKFIFDKLPLVIKKHLLYKVLILIAPIDSIRSVNIDNICAIVDKSSNFNKKVLIFSSSISKFQKIITNKSNQTKKSIAINDP